MYESIGLNLCRLAHFRILFNTIITKLNYDMDYQQSLSKKANMTSLPPILYIIKHIKMKNSVL